MKLGGTGLRAASAMLGGLLCACAPSADVADAGAAGPVTSHDGRYTGTVQLSPTAPSYCGHGGDPAAVVRVRGGAFRVAGFRATITAGGKVTGSGPYGGSLSGSASADRIGATAYSERCTYAIVLTRA